MIADFNRLGNAITKFSGVDFGLIGSYDKTMQASIYSKLGDSVQGLNTKELQLLATKYKLNEEQMRQILLTSGLNKEQTQAQLAALGFAGAEETLSTVTVQNVLATSSLDVAQQQRMLTTLGLVNSEGALIGTTEGLTASSFMAAAASTGLSEAEARQLAIQLGLIPNTATLSATVKGLTASIWGSVKAIGAFLLTNPVGWAIAATGAIVGIVKVTDWLSVSTKEATESLKNLQEEADKANSEIENLAKLIKEYESLGDKINWSNDDRDSARRIQEEITNLVGDEASAYDLVNGKIDEQIKKLRQLQADQIKDNIGSLEAAKLSAEDILKSKYIEDNFLGDDDWRASAAKDINAAIPGLKDEIFKAIGHGKYDIDAYIQSFSMEEALKKLKEWQVALNEYKKGAGKDSDLSQGYEYLRVHIEEIGGAVDAAKDSITAYNEKAAKLEVLNYSNKNNIDSQKSFDEYINSINKSKDKSDEFKNALIEAANYYFPEYSNAVKDAGDETKKFAQSVLKSAEEIDALKDSLSDLKSAYEKLQESNDSNYLSPELFETLSKYPQLFQFINNRKVLSQEMYKVIKENEKSLADAYIATAMAQYPLINVANDIINAWRGTYDELAQLYALDLSNAKNAAEERRLLESGLTDVLGGIWEGYYQSQADAMADMYSSQITALQKQYEYQNSTFLYANKDPNNRAGSSVAMAYYNEMMQTKALLDAAVSAQNSLKGFKAQISGSISSGIRSSGWSTSDKSNGKDKEDANKLAFEKAKADLDHRRAMNMISEKQYLDELDRLYKKHFSDRSKYLAEYTQYEEEVYSGRQKLLEEAKSAIEDLHDSTMDMIKKEKDAEKEAWEEKKTALQEYVDARKEALEQEKEVSDYAESLAEKQKKLNDLNLEMNSLMGDTSAEGQRRRIELAQEIADTQTELDDYVADHEYDAQMDAIDKEADAQISAYDEQIELIDEYLNNQNLLVQDAYDRMNGMSAQLKNDLIAYNKEFGTGMQQDVIDKWNDAYKAAKAYGDLMNMGGTVTTISSQIGKPPTTSGGSSGGSSSGGGSSGGGSGGGSSGGGNKPAVGSTVSVEASATNFGSKSGGVAMADFVSGGQFTVYQVSGGQVLIGRNGTYTGWVNLSDIVGYAKGTDYLPYTGFVKHGENGEEMVLGSAGDKYALLNRGSKIFTAAKTAKLDNFLSSPSDFILNSLNQKFSGRGGVLGSVTNNVSQMTNNIIFDIDGADATVVKDEIVRVIPELTRRICANLNKEIIQSGNKLNAKIMG